jgi:DNA-binding MarR family transcriptional regulator
MMRDQSKSPRAPKKAAIAPPPIVDGAPEPAETSIGYVVRQAHQSFIQSLEERLSPFGLSSAMYFFLRLLWEHDGITQREISERLGLTPPTTVSAMDNLEGKGLIQRSRNTTDRRKVNIFLTKRGRDLEAKLRQRAVEVNDVALAGISDADRDRTIALLAQMMQALRLDAAAQ